MVPLKIITDIRNHAISFLLILVFRNISSLPCFLNIDPGPLLRRTANELKFCENDSRDKGEMPDPMFAHR